MGGVFRIGDFIVGHVSRFQRPPPRAFAPSRETVRSRVVRAARPYPVVQQRGSGRGAGNGNGGKIGKVFRFRALYHKLNYSQPQFHFPVHFFFFAWSKKNAKNAKALPPGARAPCRPPWGRPCVARWCASTSRTSLTQQTVTECVLWAPQAVSGAAKQFFCMRSACKRPDLSPAVT